MCENSEPFPKPRIDWVRMLRVVAVFVFFAVVACGTLLLGNARQLMAPADTHSSRGITATEGEHRSFWYIPQ